MSRRPLRPSIVVAGGGPAALEALLTLRERLSASPRELCLIAPNETLSYRPLSTVGEFATHPPHRISLPELADSSDAGFINDRVALVDERRKALLTRDGNWIEFDYLLLAVGAHEAPIPPGRLRWPAEGDPAALRQLLDELRGGRLERLAVVIPPRSGWPLAGYELALILGHATEAEAPAARVGLMTADERPLELLGNVAEGIVLSELRRVGVDLATGAGVDRVIEGAKGGESGRPPAEGRRAERGSGEGFDAARVSFDRLISLPATRGPDIGGIASDARRFIVVDGLCRVAGSGRVWAAGDCTTLPLKHSTLAVTQADVAAENLSVAAGVAAVPRPFEPLLTGVLVDRAAERWWAETMSLPRDLEPATHCLWWPPGKVLGERLAHYVARRDPSARPHLLGHPPGTAVQVRLPTPAPPSAGPAEGLNEGEPDAPEGTLQADTHDRQVFALERLEREAEKRLAGLRHELSEQRLRSSIVLRQLNAAGYLLKEPGSS